MVISVYVMCAIKVCAQEEKSFRQSFDMLPRFKKTIVDAEEGYIIKERDSSLLRVKFAIQDPLLQARKELNGTEFNYATLIEGHFNMSDLQYWVDTDIKKEGRGSLNIKYRKKNLYYVAVAEISVFVPEFDATEATIRVWIRSENEAGRGVYVHLMNGDKLCEFWGFYKPALKFGEWQCLEATPGKASGASRHSTEADVDPMQT